MTQDIIAQLAERISEIENKIPDVGHLHLLHKNDAAIKQTYKELTTKIEDMQKEVNTLKSLISGVQVQLTQMQMIYTQVLNSVGHGSTVHGNNG